MSDLVVIAATTKMALHEVAKQASALATGLQNAAPGDKLSTPNNSIQYLFAISENLTELETACDKLLSASVSSAERKI